MKKRKLLVYAFLGCVLLSLNSSAQETRDTIKVIPKILIVPYQPMMYFSDADRDIARYSQTDEPTVRKTMGNNLEVDVYHQLLAHFEAISLVRATSLNGEEDLRRIYAATTYTLYSGYKNEHKPAENEKTKSLIKQLNKKGKENNIRVSDSTVMLASIQSDEVFRYLHKKHSEKYVLFITQLELNTSNKNMIEWTKQQYNRTYTLHYNLFDFTGKLIRAETITLVGNNENRLTEINSKYLNILAQKLVSIVEAVNE